MTFLVDVCVPHGVVEHLKAGGHTAIRVCDRDPRMVDTAILDWAREDNLILVTNDKDFGRHIFQDGAPHAGILRLPNAPAPVLRRLLSEVLSKHAHDLESGAIITASAGSIRVRRRPS